MTTSEEIREEQTRRETTAGETFEADYGHHTINKVVQITEEHGSKAGGVLFGFFWEAWSDWNGHMCVVARNPYTKEKISKSYSLVNINGEWQITALVSRILQPHLYGE